MSSPDTAKNNRVILARQTRKGHIKGASLISTGMRGGGGGGGGLSHILLLEKPIKGDAFGRGASK